MTWHLRSWLRPMRQRLVPGQAGTSKRRRPRVQLELEPLEPRVVFSTGISEFTVPPASNPPWGITSGSDGNLWLTENAANKVAKLTPGGTFTEYSLVGTPSRAPYGITSGPDSNLWFAEAASTAPPAYGIGELTTGGSRTDYS